MYIRDKTKDYTNEILDDIECYKAVLRGDICRFPKGMWTKPWSLQSARSITQYLFEDILKLTEKEIPEAASVKLLTTSRLYGLLIRVFDASVFKLLDNAYPGKYNEWDLSTVPRSYWSNEEHVKKAVKWVVSEKLDNSRDRVVGEFSSDLLLANRLSSLPSLYSLYDLLELAYPGEYKEWEINVRNGYWTDDTIKKAIKWIVEEKLGNSRERVLREFNCALLCKLGLTTLGHRHTLYELLEITYPGEYKNYEMNVVERGYWADTSNVKAYIRFIMLQDGLSFKDIISSMTNNKCPSNKLQSVYSLYGLQAVQRAIDEIIEEDRVEQEEETD